MGAIEEAAVLESIPLVTPVPAGQTSKPVPGNYYETTDGRLLMCIRAYPSAYWFVNALEDPITVLTSQELTEAPVTTINLVSRGEESGL